MSHRERPLLALVVVALLVAGCGAIEDLEDDLSTITIPDITIPDITIPDITIPDITIPDITIPESSTTTSVAEVVTPPAPATTTPPAPATTAAVAPATTAAPAPATTTVTPASVTPQTTTTVAEEPTTTEVATTSTLIAAAPTTTLAEVDEEAGRSPLWWILALLVLISAGAFALWRYQMRQGKAAELAAQEAAWAERMRGAYTQGRWVRDQLDDRLAAERAVQADPRGIRAGIETVAGDLYRLEADATNVDTRGAVHELSDAIRGLDRAIDVAAGLLTAGDEQPSVDLARARLDVALQRLTGTGQTEPPLT